MGVEEFVVLQRDGEFVRRDRADFDSPTAFVPGIFRVINEPQLFVRANFSEDAEIFPNQQMDLPDCQGAICTWIRRRASQSARLAAGPRP